MVVGSVLDVRRGRRYENFFGIPVPIIPWPELKCVLLYCCIVSTVVLSVCCCDTDHHWCDGVMVCVTVTSIDAGARLL